MGSTQPVKVLFDFVRLVIRLRQLSYTTENRYLLRIRRFHCFDGTRNPRDMSVPELVAVMSDVPPLARLTGRCSKPDEAPESYQETKSTKSDCSTKSFIRPPTYHADSWA